MVVLSDSDAHEEVAEAPDIFPDVDFDELVNAIRALSPGYRTVFNMYAVEGYTHKEIAALLGISTGTSKSQYSTARRILRSKLKIYSSTLTVKSK
jgi:RNA polymerase sigma factor (sigma-70 family)